MPEPAILAEDLHKSYGPLTALAGLSLSVPAGSVTGPLGRNGSGKTTTVSILATALRADRGRARVCGLDVASEAAGVRQVIGFAGQFAAMDPNLTGTENLVLIGRLCRLGRRPAARRAVELLEGLGLADTGGRLVRTYSGGMRRRLDLAAALVHRPAVVFLDEPTTGLDPESRRWLWEAVGDLVRDGTTVLLTIQYLEEADAACDELVVIDAGRVIATGPPAALKATTGASVVELDYASLAGAERAADSLRLAGWAPDAEGASLRVATVGSSGDAAAILRALPADALPRSVSSREATLDDAFLALTATALNGPPASPAPAGRTRGHR